MSFHRSRTAPGRAGAPLGNQNARKHGLRSVQSPAFTADPLLDFKTDIARLRRHLTRLLESLETTTDPDRLFDLHRSIETCVNTIFRLARLHLLNNPIDDQQQQAIANMTRLMRQALALPEPSDLADSASDPSDLPLE